MKYLLIVGMVGTLILPGMAHAADVAYGLYAKGQVICSNDRDPAAALADAQDVARNAKREGVGDVDVDYADGTACRTETFNVMYPAEGGPFAVPNAKHAFLIKLDLGSADTSYAVLSTKDEALAAK